MEESFLSILQVGVAKVAVCSQHGGCYTRNNIDRHLAHQHRIQRKRRVELISDLHTNGLAESKKDVQQPLDGDAPLEGLVVSKGYKCSKPPCSRISINRGGIEKHCRTAHSWEVRT